MGILFKDVGYTLLFLGIIMYAVIKSYIKDKKAEETLLLMKTFIIVPSIFATILQQEEFAYIYLAVLIIFGIYDELTDFYIRNEDNKKLGVVNIILAITLIILFFMNLNILGKGKIAMSWWGKLEVVDKAQVISAIATAIAAIAAAITTWQNHKSTKKQDEERHAMIKPSFVVTGVSEDRIKNIYKIDVENIGYNMLNSVAVKWEGAENADVEISRYMEQDKTLIYVIEMKFNEVNNDVKEVEGELILIYTNVLGKKYNENIKLVFNNIYNDVNESYYLCLKNINGESFN